MFPTVAYRSLAGGFFSPNPVDKTVGPVSIRFNNPGAINGASWERTYPGYVGEVETTPGNKSTIFETPEHGIAAWWDLLRRYCLSGTITVGGIIKRYGGDQDYSAYVKTVIGWSGLTADSVINLDDDLTLLKFGKAMFRYEAGCTIPWSDAQLLYGFQLGREHAGAYPNHAPPPLPPIVPAADPWWLALLKAIFKRKG